MEKRPLGRTGAALSVLGFGCGAVGGLMVRGSAADQERAVAKAVEAGVNFFDTAPMYGDGASERNLGRVLAALKPDIFLATKVTVRPGDMADIRGAVTASLEESLKRLGREQVDLLQLHNRIAIAGNDRPLESQVVIDKVAPALERLKHQGKIRFAGITALGDTALLQRAVDSRLFDTAQICFNLLNPSAAGEMPAGMPGQNFASLIKRAHYAGMGTIGIRVLAGGALSGTLARHPTGMEQVAPIASGADYATDVMNGRRFSALVESGEVVSPVEAAIRFAISEPALTTALIGTSTLQQLDNALAAAAKGPLPRAALNMVGDVWAEFG